MEERSRTYTQTWSRNTTTVKVITLSDCIAPSPPTLQVCGGEKSYLHPDLLLQEYDHCPGYNTVRLYSTVSFVTGVWRSESGPTPKPPGAGRNMTTVQVITLSDCIALSPLLQVCGGEKSYLHPDLEQEHDHCQGYNTVRLYNTASYVTGVRRREVVPTPRPAVAGI